MQSVGAVPRVIRFSENAHDGVAGHCMPIYSQRSFVVRRKFPADDRHINVVIENEAVGVRRRGCGSGGRQRVRNKNVLAQNAVNLETFFFEGFCNLLIGRVHRCVLGLRDQNFARSQKLSPAIDMADIRAGRIG